MSKKKKIIISCISIILVLALTITGFRIYNYDRSEAKKNTVKNFIRVKYLVAEKNNENVTMDNIFVDKFKYFQTFSDVYFDVKKEGNYYTFNI